jgi:hypothetical protein
MIRFNHNELADVCSGASYVNLSCVHALQKNVRTGSYWAYLQCWLESSKALFNGNNALVLLDNAESILRIHSQVNW